VKNYNMFALGGDPNTSDMDVCETLGLDIQLAGTPGINDAAIEQMRQKNVEGFMRSGMPEKEALAQAAEEADKARLRVETLMAAANRGE
jgi:hypothetical protein